MIFKVSVSLLESGLKDKVASLSYNIDFVLKILTKF